MTDNVAGEGPTSGAGRPWELPESTKKEKRGQLGIHPITPQAEKETPELKIAQEVPKDHSGAPQADMSQKKVSISGDRKISDVGKDVLSEESAKAVPLVRTILPLPNKLVECQLKIPTSSQQPLIVLLEGPALKKWQTEMDRLAKGDSQAAFTKDAPRSKYLIQGKFYDSDPQAKSKVDKQIDGLLQGASGLKTLDGQDRLTQEQRAVVCHQIENLLQQEAFVLNYDLFEHFQVAYLKIDPERGTLASDLHSATNESTHEENSAVRKNPYKFTLLDDGKTAVISGLRFYIIKDKAENFGYDAIGFEVRIDLTAIQPPDFLLGRDCATVKTEILGFHPSLSELQEDIDFARFSPLRKMQTAASTLAESARITSEAVEAIAEKWQKPISGHTKLERLKNPLSGQSTGEYDKVMQVASVKINDSAYWSHMPRKNTHVLERLDAELENAFAGKLAVGGVKRVRTQLENLFRLDKPLTADLQYTFVSLLDIPSTALSSSEAHQVGQTSYECQITKNKLVLSGTSYVRVLDSSGTHIGYDAIRFTATIDLNKVKQPDYLFTAGCGIIESQTLGFRKNLEEIGFQQIGPYHLDTTLENCFAAQIGGLKNRRAMQVEWQKETKDMQGLASEHPQAFIADARRDPIRLNGHLQLKDETVIGEQVTNLLRAQKPGASEEEIQKLRFEIENMIQQRLFGIDPQFNEQFNKRYQQFSLHVTGIPAPEILEKAKKQTGYQINIGDKFVEIVGTRYYSLQELKDYEYVGFEASRVKLTIDLSKVDAQKRLLSEGCGRIRMQTAGFHEKLEDISF